MRSPLLAWIMVFVAVLAWTSFGGLVRQLSNERIAYAEAESRSKEEALRGEGAARLKATVESTETERTALESLVSISILQAVEVIEQAGRAAGASDVSIGEATPSANAPKDLSAVTIVVNASGSFAAVTRAIALFETLPIPATLEQFELDRLEKEKTWRLTARLRVTMAPSQ
ncbi:MAG: hypothetical protein WA021_02895 [Minisyncoccia bacterium]